MGCQSTLGSHCKTLAGPHQSWHAGLGHNYMTQSRAYVLPKIAVLLQMGKHCLLLRLSCWKEAVTCSTVTKSCAWHQCLHLCEESCRLASSLKDCLCTMWWAMQSCLMISQERWSLLSAWVPLSLKMLLQPASNTDVEGALSLAFASQWIS